MPDLKFDAGSHTYTLGSRTLPGVTRILKGAGLIDTKWYTEEARVRGSYVHKAIHLYLLGRLDTNTIDPIIEPYFNAFLDWEKKARPEVIKSEAQIVNKALGYAGTADLICRMGRGIWVIDYKTGSISPWAAIQTAGYFLGEYKPRPGNRAGLVLKANGTWKFEPFTNPRDIQVFQAAATLQNFKLGRL